MGKEHYILDLLFPKKCAVCSNILSSKDKGFCHTCLEKVEYVKEPKCMHCGKPIEDEKEEYCQNCKGKKSFIKKGEALYVYNDAMKKAIENFKYQGVVENSQIFIDDLLEKKGSQIREKEIDLIIPIPIHKKRMRYRGFNQAQVLAKALAREMQLDFDEEILLRIENTRPQKKLGDEERIKNLKKAFGLSKDAKKRLQGKRRILLVDDIYTTGTTLETCGKLLKSIGVEEIYSLCLCIGKDY